MSTTTGKGKAIFRVVSGNFLEMFDFMVYGFYATAIAKTFFPADSAFASLMLSLATFGAGFLMRPWERFSSVPTSTAMAVAKA